MTERSQPIDKDAVELKPCPFCCGEPWISDGGNGIHFRVFCGVTACQAAGPLERCAADAVSAWNVRALTHPTEQTDGAVVEALVKCRDKFREYECQHKAKAQVAERDPTISMGEYRSRIDKARRNKEMADMCDTALAKSRQ